MATTITHSVSQGDISWTKTITGWAGVETYIVHSLSGPAPNIGPMPVGSVVPAAVDAVNTPEIFAPHSDVDGAYLLSKSGRLKENETNCVIVTLNWGPLGLAVITPELKVGDPPQLSIDTVVQDVETSYDWLGNEIAVPYSYQDPTTGELTTKTYWPTMTVAKPMSIWNYRKLSYVSGVEDQKTFVGKVNGVPFEGWPVGCVLCTAVSTVIHSIGENNLLVWETNYQFQMKELQKLGTLAFEGWATFLVYRNPDGSVPVDENGDIAVVYGNGVEVKYPYANKDDSGVLIDFYDIFNA